MLITTIFNTMRFFYFLFFILPALLISSLNLQAQSSLTSLSPEQKVTLRYLGAQSVQAVIESAELDLSNTAAVKQAVSEIIATQTAEGTTPETLSDISSILMTTIVGLATEVPDTDLPTLIEAVAAGAMEGAIQTAEKNNIPIAIIIQATAFGTMEGTMKATNPVPGDINGDGIVDKRDRLALLAAASTGSFSGAVQAGTLAGDVNNDGVVDKRDLTEILNATAAGLAEGAVQTAVELAIDINDDGLVDASDLEEIAETIAQSVTANMLASVIETSGDMNNDGVVDKKDFQIAFDGTSTAVAKSVLITGAQAPYVTIEDLANIASKLVDAPMDEVADGGYAMDPSELITNIEAIISVITQEKFAAPAIPRFDTPVDDVTLVSPSSGP